MRTEVSRISRPQPHVPYLWIQLAIVLALATAFLSGGFAKPESLTAYRAAAEAPTTLEPFFSPPGGYYDRDTQLRIIPPSSSRGSTVIFTLDGRVPTHTVGSTYVYPIRLRAASPAVTVVRARAVLPDGKLGPVVSASYFVGVQATLPLISLIVEPDDLWSPERGIYANSSERGDEWERPVDITYADKDRRSGFRIAAGMRIHGQGSRDFAKKSLRLYFRQEYGTGRLEYPLYSGGERAHSNVASFKRLVLHNGGQDLNVFPHLNWTLVRNQLADRLAFAVGGHAGRSQPVLVFINGKSWGIYQIRERMDRYFLADHYGVEQADSLDSPGSLLEDVRTGDGENWEHLLRFVETHDMADPGNYVHVESQVDIANFIDYTIVQIYLANTNWPHHNVQQFHPLVQGGRWRWMFWDSDHGFGQGPRGGQYYADILGRLLDRVHPETGGRDTLLFRSLLENPAFLEQFLSRAADLLNTTLRPESVLADIDAVTNELAPDIIYETVRWSSLTRWESNVEELREFARRRPHFVRQHLTERLSSDGTVELTFDLSASGSGTVAVNGALVENLPWHGIYFQGTPVRITAAPEAGYRFAGWDPPGLPQTPTITLRLNAAQTITSYFEPLEESASRPADVILARVGTDGRTEEDRFELRVTRPGGVDLRGWRVTDNDTKTATDEGSLVFTSNPAFAQVPQNTAILVVVAQASGEELPLDDLDTSDRRMVVFAGNGNLDTTVDPGFYLGPNDNLVLLAPGFTKAFEDDQGIAFLGGGTPVTSASFGVLADGVSDLVSSRDADWTDVRAVSPFGNPRRR